MIPKKARPGFDPGWEPVFSDKIKRKRNSARDSEKCFPDNIMLQSLALHPEDEAQDSDGT